MREFRAHHSEYVSAGLEVAGVSLDAPGVARDWVRRLTLPYPLLSDSERQAGAAFGTIRRIGLAGFSLELFRRATFLVDRTGIVRAVWEKVKVRGHAREVLDVALALEHMPGPPEG